MRLALILWLLTSSAFGQIAVVTHTVIANSGSVSGASVTSTAINTTGANLILLCKADATSGTASAPVDSQGNAWTLAASFGSATVWAAFNPSTSASHTFTVNGYYPGAAIAAYSGVASGPDQVNAGTSTSGAGTGAMTPTHPDELVYSCLSGSGPGPVTTSIASPMTILDTATSYGYPGNLGASDAQQIQGTTASSVNPAWTINVGFAAVSATFYATLSPAPLTVPAFTLPEAFVGAAYSYQLVSQGGVAPKTWTVSGTLPAGLSMSVAGLISGTPTTAGTTSGLVFTVTDTNSNTASSGAKSLIVAAHPLSIASSCPAGTQRVAYVGCNLNPSGGTPPLTTAYLTDSSHIGIPEGLSINPSTGVISGTITGQGDYQTVYTVADSAGSSIQQEITIAVTGDNSYGPLFPSNNFFHGGFDISALPVDTSPAAPPSLPGYLAAVFGNLVGTDGGIPVNLVPSTQPNIPVSCPGPTCYQNPVTSGPFSSVTAIENTQNNSSASMYLTDGHAPVVRTNSAGTPVSLYESWTSQYDPVHNAWLDASNQVWDLTAYSWVNGAGSSDAAGLPIAPLLAIYDQVMGPGGQKTPIRFTMPSGSSLRAHVWPATTQAGGGACTGGYVDPMVDYLLLQSNPPTSCGGGTSTRIPFGEIYRLKAGATLPSCATNASTNPQTVSLVSTMTHYGIIFADQGLGIGLVGTADHRWNDADLACFRNISGSLFEPVNVTSLITANGSGVPQSMAVPSSVTATTTTLTASATTLVYGVPLTLTATVTPAATGTVNFLDTGTSLGTCTLSGGTCGITSGSLAVGSHTVTAAYGGSSSYGASSSVPTGIVVTPPVTAPQRILSGNLILSGNVQP